jgi:hypothetical protein
MKIKLYHILIMFLCTVHCQTKPLYKDVQNTTRDEFSISYRRIVRAHSDYILTTAYDSLFFQKKGMVVVGKKFTTSNGKIVREFSKFPFQIILWDKREAAIKSASSSIPGFPLFESDTIASPSFIPFVGDSGYYGKMIKIKGDTVLKIGEYSRPCYRYKQHIFDSNFFEKHQRTQSTLMTNEFFVDKEWYFPLGAVYQNINQADFIPDTMIFVATHLKIKKRR